MSTPLQPPGAQPTGPTNIPSQHGSQARSDVTRETASEEAKALASERHVQLRGPVEEIFELLREVEALDIHSETIADSYASKRGKIGCVMLVCIIPPVLILLGWIILPLGGLAMLILYFKERGYRQYDVPDDFRKVLIPVLDAVRNDIPPKGKVGLELDLRGPCAEKEVQRPDSGKDGAFLFWRYKREYYVDRWGKLQVPVADGSLLVFEFWNEFLKRTRQRKGKVKWKKVSCARVTLVPPSQAMTWGQADYKAADFLGVGKIKGGPKDKGGRPGHQLTAKSKFKRTYGIPDGTLDPERVVQMALQLYSMVQPRARAS